VLRSGSARGNLCVPKTLSASCDQAIFVDQAASASLSSDAVVVEVDWFGQRFQRRGAVQGAVRPVLIVVGLVLAQDPSQMGCVPDEGAVQELAAASAATPAQLREDHIAASSRTSRQGLRISAVVKP
jgi:hypothetical protein